MKKILEAFDFNNELFEFYLTCPITLENELASELETIGIEGVHKSRGFVECHMSFSQFVKVLAHSKISGRIFLKAATIDIENEKDIHKKAKELPWEDLFSKTLTFKITTNVKNKPRDSKEFNNTIYLSQVLKDAVVDRFSEKVNSRPSVEIKNPDIIFLQNIDLRKKTSTIYINLTNPPLSKRHPFHKDIFAPLRENLAAGLAMKIKSMVENTPEVFIDGMTGGSTMLIEANSIFYDQLPVNMYIKQNQKTDQDDFPFGIKRFNFYRKNKPFSKELKNLFLKEIKNHKINNCHTKFLGLELDQKASEISKNNISSMKHLKNLSSIQANFFKYVPDEKNGVLFLNPPYGDRLMGKEDMDEFFQKIGETIKKNYKNFDCFVILPEEQLKKSIDIEAVGTYPFHHGGKHCELVHYKP